MYKIAFLNDSMVMGGTEKVLVNLLKSIDYNTVSVDLFLYNQHGFLLEQIPSEVSVYELPNTIVTTSKGVIKQYLSDFKLFSAINILGIKFLHILSMVCNNRKLTENLSKLMMIKKGEFNRKYNATISNHYDAVVAFQGGDPGLQFFAGYIFNADKRIMWIHGNIGNQHSKQLLSAFDKIICVSQSIKNWFCNLYPDFIENTLTIYNLLDVDDILKKSSEPINDFQTEGVSIVSVGRLSEEKGFQLIPQIAQRLNNDGFSFKWYVIGDGDLFDPINNKIKELGVSSIHMLGEKNNPYPYMKQCTLYVQPSFTEGYCTTTNEAKVLCKPVVATDVPGMREQFIHGYDGYIVPQTTVDDIADGIEYLLNNNKLRESIEINLHNYYLHCNDGLYDIEKVLYH